MNRWILRWNRASAARSAEHVEEKLRAGEGLFQVPFEHHVAHVLAGAEELALPFVPHEPRGGVECLERVCVAVVAEAVPHDGPDGLSCEGGLRDRLLALLLLLGQHRVNDELERLLTEVELHVLVVGMQPNRREKVPADPSEGRPQVLPVLREKNLLLPQVVPPPPGVPSAVRGGVLFPPPL